MIGVPAETCDWCQETFRSDFSTHAAQGEVVAGRIMAGFCSSACEQAWFREDRIARMDLELMADLEMEPNRG